MLRRDVVERGCSRYGRGCDVSIASRVCMCRGVSEVKDEQAVMLNSADNNAATGPSSS